MDFVRTSFRLESGDDFSAVLDECLESFILEAVKGFPIANVKVGNNPKHFRYFGEQLHANKVAYCSVISGEIDMLALALACTLSFPGQSRISYDRPMSTVMDALAAISKDSGKTIEYDGIARLPILIHAKDVEPQALLEQIAKATDSVLSTTSTGFRLVRSASRIQQAIDKEKAELAVRLKESIDKRKEEWTSAADWSDAALQAKADAMAKRLEQPLRDNRQTNAGQPMYMEILFGNSNDSPSSIVMAKLFAQTPVATWIPDQPGGVLRLSDKPNRYQRKLPVDLRQAYGQFAAAHNRFRAQMNARLSLENVNIGYADRDLSPQEVDRTVVLASWRESGWVSLNVYLLDQQGNIVSRTMASLSLASKTAEGDPAIASETVIETDPKTIEFAKALRNPGASPRSSVYQMTLDGANISLGRFARTPKHSEAVLNRLCEELDPFEDVSGLALRRAAAEERKNVVAVFPEVMFVPSQDLALRPKYTLKDFGTVLRNADVSVIRDGEWMVVTPRLASHLDRNLVDRASLAKYSKLLRNQGYASLEQTSEYVRRRNSRISNGSMDYLWIKALNAVQAEHIIADQASLALFGSLPADLKRTDQFSGPIQGEVAKAVTARITNYLTGGSIIGSGTIISQTVGRPRSTWIGSVDATEPLAMGLVSFEIRNKEQLTLFVQRNSESGGRFINPKEIGIYRVMAKQTQYAEFNSELLPYDRYQKAKSRRVEMLTSWRSLGQEQQILAADNLEDNAVEPGSGVWTWDTIPADIKNAIIAAEKEYATQTGGG